MGRLFAKLLVGCTLASLLVGCMPPSRYRYRRSGGLGFAAGVIIGAAIAEGVRAARHHHDPERPYRFYSNGYFDPPAVPRSPRDLVPEDDGAPSFDPVGARAALNQVDLSACQGSGARGFGHAKVTFRPDGTVSKVVIDEPPGISAAQVDCIGRQLGAVTVPPFKGNEVVVGTTFRLP